MSPQSRRSDRDSRQNWGLEAEESERANGGEREIATEADMGSGRRKMEMLIGVAGVIKRDEPSHSWKDGREPFQDLIRASSLRGRRVYGAVSASTYAGSRLSGLSR